RCRRRRAPPRPCPSRATARARPRAPPPRRRRSHAPHKTARRGQNDNSQRGGGGASSSFLGVRSTQKALYRKGRKGCAKDPIDRVASRPLRAHGELCGKGLFFANIPI